MALKSNDYIFTWKSAWGWQGLLFSGAGIRCFVFGEKTRRDAEKNLLADAPKGLKIAGVSELPSEIRRAREQLDRYFGGDTVKFNLEIDTRGRSDFAVGVWETALKIPYGEVRTYGEIARKCGAPAAARAVGGALGANPVPIIIPCHRVVRSSGGLGGFSRGIEWKRRLLALESAGND